MSTSLLAHKPLPAVSEPVGPYTLPPLAYGYGAFEPAIDTETMRLHYTKHHQAYITGLNTALARYPAWLGRTIEDVLTHIDDIPEDIRATVRSHGGGHINHQFFWSILAPDGAIRPSGTLAEAIDQDFGSFDEFKAKFEEAGMRHSGSGWTVLVARPKRKMRLEVLTLSNQDSLFGLTQPAIGLLTCDLWEHAYYLKHRNRRADWLKAFWGVVDWDRVVARFEAPATE